jgi:hypothetical protein
MKPKKLHRSVSRGVGLNKPERAISASVVLGYPHHLFQLAGSGKLLGQL